MLGTSMIRIALPLLAASHEGGALKLRRVQGESPVGNGAVGNVPTLDVIQTPADSEDGPKQDKTIYQKIKEFCTSFWGGVYQKIKEFYIKFCPSLTFERGVCAFIVVAVIVCCFLELYHDKLLSKAMLPHSPAKIRDEIDAAIEQAATENNGELPVSDAIDLFWIFKKEIRNTLRSSSDKIKTIRYLNEVLLEACPDYRKPNLL